MMPPKNRRRSNRVPPEHAQRIRFSGEREVVEPDLPIDSDEEEERDPNRPPSRGSSVNDSLNNSLAEVDDGGEDEGEDEGDQGREEEEDDDEEEENYDNEIEYHEQVEQKVETEEELSDMDDLMHDENNDVDRGAIDLFAQNSLPIVKSRNQMAAVERKLFDFRNLIQRVITDEFRLVFQSRQRFGEDMAHAAQRIGSLYKKVRSTKSTQKYNMRRIFFNQLDVRLSMMLEETSVGENRARVFKLVGIICMDAVTGGYGDEFVQFLLNYIGVWSCDENVSARINAVCLAGYVLEAGLNKSGKDASKFCGFSSEVSAAFYKFIVRSLLDKDSSGRIPGIRGMGIIQGVPIPSSWPAEARAANPRELLIRSCRDVHPDCRATAIKTLKPQENDVRLLTDIIYFDTALNVRIAALSQFGQLKPYRFVWDKLQMLMTATKDHEHAIREGAKGVIRDWLESLSKRWSEKQNKPDDPDIQEIREENEEEKRDRRTKGYLMSAQALVLLWLSDTPETTEYHGQLRRIIRYTLDVVRQMYLCYAEPINTFADVIINDLREKMLEGSIPIITKSSIGSIMMDCDLAEGQDVSTTRAMIIFWRAIIEYMAENSRNDADKFNALARFLSPMKTMVDHFDRILLAVKKEENHPIRGKDDDSIDDTYTLQMSMVENTLSVLRHAQVDQTGKDAYKRLLLSMMMNPFYQKKVIDAVIQEYVKFFSTSPSDLFALVQSKLNEMRENYKGNRFPTLEGCVLVGEQKIRKDWRLERELKNNGISEKEQGMAQIDFFELKLLNSILKTGILPSWDNAMNERYLPFFRKFFESDNLDARVLSHECIGMVATYRLEIVENEIRDMFERLETEVEPIQAVIILTLTDLYIEHLDHVNRITYSSDKRQDFTQVLSAMILNTKKSTETLLRMVEAMARVLLNAEFALDDPNFECNVIAMIFRSTWSMRGPLDARIRSLIIVTMKFFGSLNVYNQYLILHGYERFCEMWSTCSTPELLTENRADVIPKMKRCAALFVSLTRHSNLPLSLQKSFRPTHIKLLDDIIDHIGRDTMSGEYFAYCYSAINFEDFTREEQKRIHLNMVDCIASYGDERHRFADLKRAERRLAKILGIDAEAPGVYPDEPESQATQYSDVNRRGLKKKKKRHGSTLSEDSTSLKLTRRGKVIQSLMDAIREDREGTPTDDESDDESGSEEEDDEEEEDDDLMEDPNIPSSSSMPTRQMVRRPAPRATATPVPVPATKKRPQVDPLELLNSPPRVQKKLPTRPATGSRRAPTPASTNRTTPLRTSRRLAKDK